MRRGLIALNPKAGESDSLEIFCNQVQALQKSGLWDELNIVSVIHRSYFPSADKYQDRRDKFMEEIRDSLTAGIGTKLQYGKIEVLEATSSTDDDVIRLISEWALRKRMNTLIIGVDSRQRPDRWPFGGIPATATFISPLPLVIVNVREAQKNGSEAWPSIVLAIDVLEPPSLKALRRLSRLVHNLKAQVNLVHVLRKKKFLASQGKPVATFDRARRVLYETAFQLQEFGIECSMEILKEEDSVARSLSDYAQQKNACIVAVTSPVRDIKHRLIWGSTTQTLLGELKCPLLVLRVR